MMEDKMSRSYQRRLAEMKPERYVTLAAEMLEKAQEYAADNNTTAHVYIAIADRYMNLANLYLRDG